MNKTSRFIYKTASFCDGFFIRKKKWNDLLEENSYVAKAYTEKLTKQHDKQCLILAKQKKIEIEKLYKTAHVDQYKFVASFESDTDEEKEQFKELNAQVAKNVLNCMGGGS